MLIAWTWKVIVGVFKHYLGGWNINYYLGGLKTDPPEQLFFLELGGSGWELEGFNPPNSPSITWTLTYLEVALKKIKLKNPMNDTKWISQINKNTEKLQEILQRKLLKTLPPTSAVVEGIRGYTAYTRQNNAYTHDFCKKNAGIRWQNAGIRCSHNYGWTVPFLGV